MRILITGASGFIGRHLTMALKEQGHEVIACIRNTRVFRQYHPSIETISCDFSKDTGVSDWLSRLASVDIVINAVGIIHETHGQRFSELHRDTPIALFKACEIAGVKRVIQISALGANEAALSQYHIIKRSADQYLEKLDIDWVIVMPSIVYGSGARSMAFFKALASLPVTPLIEKGEQLIQPIHINDFTRAIAQLVESNVPLRMRIPLVGPEPVSIKELYGDLKVWLGIKRKRFVRLPAKLVISISGLLHYFTAGLASKQNIQMLRQGNTHTVEPFINRFGFKPACISTALEKEPAWQADKWHARLLCIRPWLILSIAFIWFYTGIVSVFLYPVEQSYAMLAQVGIAPSYAPFFLYAAALLNMALGLATLARYRLKIVGQIQILVILFYTIIITLFLSEQWVHPFGPISKNIPLILAIMIMMVMEEE